MSPRDTGPAGGGLDLVVAGDCNPDVLVLGGDVTPAFGQQEKLVDSISLVIGGSAAITAVAAARLGLRVALAAAVGDDPAGEFMLAQLAREGVDVSAVVIRKGVPTGMTVALSRGGDRAILTALGAVASLTAADIPRSLLARARHVHASSYFLLADSLGPGLADVLADARAGGATTSLDTNWDPSGRWGDQHLPAVLAEADLLLPNEAEALRLTGAASLDAAVHTLTSGGPGVAVKLGERGALCADETGWYRVSLPPVVPVDATGAGDCFDAGLIAGLLAGRALPDAAALGCAAGALSTGAPGGTGSAPDMAHAAALAGLATIATVRTPAALRAATPGRAGNSGKGGSHMRGARISGLMAGTVLLAVSGTAVTPALAGHESPLARAATQAAALPAPVPCNASAGSCWRPPVVARWQYQLQGSVNSAGQCLYPSTGFINTGITGTSFATGQQVAPLVFDIDIYQDGKCYTPSNYGIVNTAAVSALHAQGDKVIGYIDAGTAETWRPDYPQYQSFNASCGGCLFGKPVSGFKDEYWLNINTNVSGTNPDTGQTETAQRFILDELTARLATARSAGADAIEFDNVDGYQNNTGLTISAATQEQFDATIANLAHSDGFTVGLKNDLGQAGDLQPYFDFAINEQCWQYKECDFPAPGLQAWPSTYGKAVFNVEYKLAASKFCPQANSSSYNFNSILKDVNLYDVPYTPCR